MTTYHPTGRVPALRDLGSRPLPDQVSRQVHRIPAGGRLDCPRSPWEDALAVLEVGCVELRVASGAGLHLCPGAIVSLRGLTPAVLIPTELGPTVLVTLRRRTEGEASS
jgi:hypothetical protein